MRALLVDVACGLSNDGPPLEPRRLGARLAEHGVQVDLVTGRPPPEKRGPSRPRAGGPEAATRNLRVHGARVRSGRRPRARRGGVRCLVSALRVARRLLRGRHHDLVHLFHAPRSGAFLRFLPLGDAVLVVSLGGPASRMGRERRMPGLPRRFARWSWSRADAVVAGCENEARLARAVHPNGRITVIRPGVDLELFRSDRRRADAGGPIRCLAVGSLVERTAVHDLLHAWTYLERGACRLEIAGAGRGETRLRGVARALGVEDDVVFTGPLDHEQVASRYRVADLFVLCPVRALCGTAFARALAAGLPVVGSRVGGVPELVANGVNGLLVSPGDPEAIAAAVRRLAEDPALRERMRAANRARAEELLPWERTGDAYERLYRDLLDTRRRVSRQPLLVRPRRARHPVR